MVNEPELSVKPEPLPLDKEKLETLSEVDASGSTTPESRFKSIAWEIAALKRLKVDALKLESEPLAIPISTSAPPPFSQKTNSRS